MVVGQYFLQLEVNEVLGVKRTLLLFWFRRRLRIKVPVRGTSSDTTGKEDKREVATLFGRGGGGIGADAGGLGKM